MHYLALIPRLLAMRALLDLRSRSEQDQNWLVRDWNSQSYMVSLHNRRFSGNGESLCMSVVDNRTASKL